MIREWRHYPATVRRLVTARFLRSVGQGLLVVDFSLYLKALGWHPARIGLVLAAGGLFGALLALGVGWLSDRWGRKRFVLVYEAMTVVSAAIAGLTASGAWLSVIAIGASFGRGQGGGAGPFGPAEQAWIGGLVRPDQRGRLFSWNASVGFIGMGLGSLLAALPAALSPWLPGALAFRPLFAIPLAGSLLNIVLIARQPDGVLGEVTDAVEERTAVRAENRSLAKLMMANLTNGLAVGMVGPLMAVWFTLRFGVSPAAIGGIMAASFMATAWASLVTAWFGERVGIVRTIVGFRVVSVMFLAALPLAPNFPIAAALFFVRSALNRGSVGARQAVSVSLTRDARRGWAASVNFVSMRVPASVGPALTGLLMESGQLALPLYAAAGLQLVYAVLYQRFFGTLDRNAVTAISPGR
ncbi:MAG: MFS transporter [Thermaerobacter sp.]|nr:MFS transporter [Thermaerobacter sp.]